MPARRLSPSARLLLPVALLLIASGWFSRSAEAAIPWTPCPAAPHDSSQPTTGYQCATVPVPLDYTGAVPGAVTLSVARVAAASNPTNTAVVPLAGGPGQAALPISQDFATILKPAIADRDLLVYDQRGTGSSGVLNCDDVLNRSTTAVKAAKGCADQLGADRGFYRTADSVGDIEALRVAGGYSKLVLFGVSYGTKVAEDYAAAYPQNVEALVLDSVVPPEGPDPFQRSTLANAPRVLQDLCANKACRGATDNVKSDLSRLAAKLRKHVLRGKVTIGSGQRVKYAMDQTGLLDILLAGDLNPTLRAELPGSMRAALRGDASPLLRLSVRSEGLTTGLQTESNADQSNGLYLATTCEEAPFAWTRAANVDQRTTEITAAAKAIPKAQLGPFSPSAALNGGLAPAGRGWPDASPAPAATAPLPPVRTLILDGQMDLRTPYEDAAQVAARIPGSTLVQVPFTGHSTVTSDETKDSACTTGALATFFAGGMPAPCAPGTNPFSPTRRPPTNLGQLGIKSPAKRTIEAAEASVGDAARQIIGDALALDKLPLHVGGLRGGNATVTGNAPSFRLTHYQYIPGVLVSGTVNKSFDAKVTIRGGGALSGSLKLASSGAVSGTLNGKRVRIAASSAVRSTLPSLASALARPHLGR
jgi:pimeloyl-ACP methyl ester carboxylesterase